MPVLDFYRGKNVLITGTTGFLGKVVLEKFLRVIPDVGRIIVLIRKKRGSPVMERFKKEVIGSPCFDVVRKMHSNFNELINTKITAVEGDLLRENLDLSAENYRLITENVHVIINSAASVDFNARLDDAISINVRGTLRMFALAQACKNLQNFLHVSTCYVNSDKKSGTWLDEKVYDIGFDAEEKIEQLAKLPVETLARESSKLIGDFPNTYTFTKSMCERILLKRKGNTPLTILRPSIIGSSFRDPCPGWVDTISAAGALYFLGGLGILHAIEGNLDNVGDQIPVDYVSDYIIVAAACYAQSPEINVVHAASSTKHPVTWRIAGECVQTYFNANPPEKQVSRVWFRMIPNRKILKTYQYTQRVAPFVYTQTAKALQSSSMQKKAGVLKKVVNRSEAVGESFKHFTVNEWFFKVDKTSDLQRFCTPEENEIFQLDVTKIEWRRYLTTFCWGLQKFVLKENVEQPSQTRNFNMLDKHSHYLNDVQWAINKGQAFYPRPNSEMKSLIMNSSRVQETIKKLLKGKKDKSISDEQYIKILQKKGDFLCESMFATYSMPTLRMMAWFMDKILKSMYEKIVVDETVLKRFRNFDQKQSGPIVLMPTHRSYMDFLLVSYVFFAYGLKAPHIAAAEDFLNIHVIHRLLRASGAFFIRRKEVEPMELYKAVLYEYIQRLLLDESWLEFFVEGTRSRVGKMLTPKFGLLSIVTDTYFDQKLPDVQIVPVTINYEKIVEGETFPFELLGESKVKESLLRVVKAASVLKKNFGRVHIEFAEPISLKVYTEKYGKTALTNEPENLTEKTTTIKEFNPYENPSHRKLLVRDLAHEVIARMHEKLVIMPTAIVATVILMYRKGIKEEELVSQVEIIAQELACRGIKVATINASTPSVAVKMALTHLDNLLNKKKDIFHPSVSAKSDYKNILMLSYYRNTLLFAFFNDALIACSLMAFGHDLARKEGVGIERLWEEVSFLQKLVKDEVVTNTRLTRENLREYINFMCKRGMLDCNNDVIKVNDTTGEQATAFLCSLIWPFIESYWVTTVFAFSLKNRKSPPTTESFLQECQWFAETMHEERLLEYFESCSVDTIKNAYSCLKLWNIVRVESRYNDAKKTTENLLLLETSEEKLLELESHIKKFMKYSYATSVRSPIERARKTILVDFPFMAKI